MVIEHEFRLHRKDSVAKRFPKATSKNSQKQSAIAESKTKTDYISKTTELLYQSKTNSTSKIRTRRNKARRKHEAESSNKRQPHQTKNVGAHLLFVLLLHKITLNFTMWLLSLQKDSASLRHFNKKTKSSLR